MPALLRWPVTSKPARLEHQADSLYASGSRHSQCCLDARRYPGLFDRPAAGVCGSSLWFEDEQGVLTLKLHSKGQALTDLLREPCDADLPGTGAGQAAAGR